MIRPAKAGDIQRLWEIMQEMHLRSVYAGRGSLRERDTKAVFLQAVQRHGGKFAGSTLFNVVERDGRVEGFLLGVLAHIFDVGDKLMATDQWFYCTELAHPLDAILLLRAFEEWAEKVPDCIEIKLGVTDHIGDWQRVAALYEARGLRQCGAILERRIDR